jgi:tRNA 5-methylaminomethyl-2-thiouridine biosynthesis bifunctional protein
MQIIVVGAGLAGAACAHALALRGCEVTVFEASPAALASAAPSAGLPVALMAPHYSHDDHAISQLSRLGVAATTQAARTLLLDGQDWQACGALQRAGKLGPQARWFADAAWVKPAALVAAWLAHPRICLRSGVPVHSLQRSQGAGGQWQALHTHGGLLAQADACVLANAYQAKALLERLHEGLGSHDASTDLQQMAAALHQVAGQIVYGPWTADWQALWPTLLPELAQHRPSSAGAQALENTNFCAINGNGHFIPAVPWGPNGERIWLSGSTYEHDTAQWPQVTAQGITANLRRLQQLIPAAAALLGAQHHAGTTQGWAGSRCTTRERLPMVGAVSPAKAPGLYACTAMGSRGLSFAGLCGQHLASVVMHSQDSPLPAPLPAHLQRAITPGTTGRAMQG